MVNVEVNDRVRLGLRQRLRNVSVKLKVGVDVEAFVSVERGWSRPRG
jgi:hypothetical protein